jgi:putative membrane protein
MAFLPIWHTIGGHYTFERVPFDWFNDLFGYSRNMYDRIGHFSVGFFAAGFIEYFYNIKNKMSFGLAALFAFCIIGTVAGVYEIVEWIYAVKEGGSAGLAFLGSQGDIWDAQKDMGLDMLGGLLVIMILWVRQRLFINSK